MMTEKSTVDRAIIAGRKYRQRHGEDERVPLHILLPIVRGGLRQGEIAQLREGKLSPGEQAEKLFELFAEFKKGGTINPDGTAIQMLLRGNIERQTPIATYMFWGAGDKTGVTPTDHATIDKIASLQNKLAFQHQPGTDFTLILADMHALNNGYGDLRTRQLQSSAATYIEGITDQFTDRKERLVAAGRNVSIKLIALSQLYEQFGISFDLPDETLHQALPIYEKHNHFLLRNAENHSRNGTSAEENALRYVARRVHEQAILEQAFPSSILLATGISEGADDIILPNGRTAVFLGGKSPWFEK